MKKRFIIVWIILAFIVAFCIFSFIKIKEKASIEKDENYVQIEEPEVAFGEWIPVSESDLDNTVESNYNGKLLYEYSNENVLTQIRVHHQKIKFLDDSYILEKRKNDETVTWVYDSPDTKNFLFLLAINEEFNISKFRRDFDRTTGQISYWLEISENDKKGWILMLQTFEPIDYLYENNYWNIEAALFPDDKSKRIFHIRKVDVSCFISNGVKICSQPMYRNAKTDYIEAVNENKTIKIKAITADEDMNRDIYNDIWYLIDDGEKQGWCLGSDNFVLWKGGTLINKPEYVISNYYYIGE